MSSRVFSESHYEIFDIRRGRAKDGTPTFLPIFRTFDTAPRKQSCFARIQRMYKTYALYLIHTPVKPGLSAKALPADKPCATIEPSLKKEQKQ
jgi:hypothetical protein